jgi:hypothetical protein
MNSPIDSRPLSHLFYEAVMELSPILWIFGGILVIYALSSLVGAAYNGWRARRMARWLRVGLSITGKPSQVRWLNPLRTAGQIVVHETRSPFRKVDAAFALEPLHNLPGWVLRRIKGKRDEVIVRADLRSTPGQEIEAGRSANQILLAFLHKERDKAFNQVNQPAGYTIGWRGAEDAHRLRRLQQLLENHPYAVERISLRREITHLALRLDAVGLFRASSESLFDALRKWLG